MPNNENKQWPETLSLLLAVFKATLIRLGVEQDRATRFSERLISELAITFGGRMFYLPKGDKLKRALRDERILAEFDGTNHQDLARKYQLSVVSVYNIIKGARNRATSRNINQMEESND